MVVGDFGPLILLGVELLRVVAVTLTCSAEGFLGACLPSVELVEYGFPICFWSSRATPALIL